MNMTDLKEPRPGAEVSIVRCLYSLGMGQSLELSIVLFDVDTISLYVAVSLM